MLSWQQICLCPYMASNPKTLTSKAKTIATNPTNQHYNTKTPNSSTPAKPPPFTGSWADKIRVTDTNIRCTLNPIPRKPTGSRLKLNGSLWEKSAVDWRRCLVGFFPGYKFSFHTMNSIANRIWKRFGLEDVTSLANGFTMFFSKQEMSYKRFLKIDLGCWGESHYSSAMALRVCLWHEQDNQTSNMDSDCKMWNTWRWTYELLKWVWWRMWLKKNTNVMIYDHWCRRWCGRDWTVFKTGTTHRWSR